MGKKRLMLGILLGILTCVPGVLGSSFVYELNEVYNGVHLENLFPCGSQSISIDLGSVFPVYEVQAKTGYSTGVCDHRHNFDAGVMLFLGNQPVGDGAWAVSGRCSKCGWNWYSHNFGGKLASRVKVCGGDDNGGKLTWGGYGGYPYIFNYNLQSQTGSIERLAIDSVLLEKVSDAFEEISALQGQVGWSVNVKSKNPRVKVWFSTGGQSTTDVTADVLACADTDQNGQCDAEQAGNCDAANGQDWYKGMCCNAQTAQGQCAYVGSVSAICGRVSQNVWKWAPLDEPGEVQLLTDCPGGSVVSNGTRFFQCGGQPLANSNTDSFGTFRNVSLDGFTHDYYCFAKNLYECAGSQGAFSQQNARIVGDTVSAGLAGCPQGMIAYWKLDNNAQDSFGTNHGTTDRVSFGSNRDGTVAIFDGDNDRIEVLNAPALNPSTGLTVEAWVLPLAVSSTRAILNKGNAYELVIKDGALQGAIKRGGTWGLQGSSPIPENQWSHVAMTYDGANMRLYINGQSAGEFVMTGMIDSSDNKLFLGERADVLQLPNSPFHGSIDEVAVYDRALTQAELISHKGAATSYCPSTAQAEVYYCASDGDWTKDLDVKDKLSCDAANFFGTGSKCCSEADDQNEYYNDPLVPPAAGSFIVANDSAEIIDDNIILRDDGDWVKLQGPAVFVVNVWSEYYDERFGYILCDKLLPLSGVKIVGTGQTFYKVNAEPGPSTNPTFECTSRIINISVQPYAVESGGCWNKALIRSGDFSVAGRVINYRGQFYSCRLDNIIDSSLLALNDTHNRTRLIDNSIEPCGYVLYYAKLAGLPHAVCRPTGLWDFTDELIGTINKSIAWSGLMNVTGVAQSGCCAFNQCWNGTKCQSLGSFYRIGDAGFMCKIGS